MPEANIKYLKNKEIDKVKWDKCVKSADNGLIYGYSFYLDCMAKHWDGIVVNDYEAVMPIPWNKKYGFSYLYQPPLTQQLGLFTKGDQVSLDSILKVLKEHYKFWEFNFNYATPAEKLTSPISFKRATNFILELSKGYEELNSRYSQGFAKTLKKSKRFQLTYRPADHTKCIMHYRKYYGDRIKHVTEKDYSNFEKLCKIALTNKMLICREAVNSESEDMSSILLLSDGKRLYNLMNSTTEKGKSAESNRFLFDSVIREFAGKELIFDLEGSDLPGVRTFYKQLGGTNQPYYKVKYNRLPMPIRLLK
jgi:hypothetical protein